MSAAKGAARAAGAGRYKQYLAYKDSGVEWLGEIPAGWEVKRLRFVSGTNPVPSEVRGLPGDTEVSFVPMEAVGEHGGLSLETTKQLADLKAGYTYFRNGDIVIAKITPCFENGKGALAAGLTNGIAFGTTELRVLRTNERADRRFMFYVTLSDAFRRLGEADMYGAGGQKRVSESFVRNFSPALPSLPEQRAIAAFLDRETARIDALVAKKERLIELLQEQRTALITRAVTKGLDPTVPMKDSGVEWLGEIPAHWEVKPVGTVAHSLVGLPFPSEQFSFGEGTRLVRGDNVTTEALRWGDKTRAWLGPAPHPRYYLMAEDIVIGMDGSKVGRNYALVPEDDLPLLLVQRVTRLRARPIIKPGFLFWSIAGPRFHAHVDTHKSDPAIPHITLKDIETYPIAVPPADEQLAILNRIAVAGGRIHALEQRVRDATDLLKELRTALISAAVTGKIDVRDEVA